MRGRAGTADGFARLNRQVQPALTLRHAPCGPGEQHHADLLLELSTAIEVTLVEPGFFRTDLLAPQSVVFGEREVGPWGDGAQAGRIRGVDASNRI